MSFWVLSLQPILRNLKERALRAFNEYRNRHASPSSLDIQLRIGPEDEFHDELAIFGGQTRVVTNKFLSRKRTRIPTKPRGDGPFSPTSTTSTTPAPPPPSTTPLTASTPSDDGQPLPQNVEEQMSNIHPSLMEYLSLFPSDASVLVVNPPQVPPQQPQHRASLDATTASTSSTESVLGPSTRTTSPNAFIPHQPSQSIGVLSGAIPQPEVKAQFQAQNQEAQPQAGSSMAPLDPLQFLDVLPDANAAGPITDASFFAMGPNMSTGIFDGSFAPGELGEQWTSLMRQTGFFDAPGMQDAFAGHGDTFPQY